MLNRAVKTARLALVAVLALAVAPAGAVAAEARPSVSGRAWYWEQQQEESPGDVTNVTLLPNPFEPGRLPVEVVNGDYETPDKISAVAFDLAMVPFGSTVKKFTATFAESTKETEAPVNIEGKRLQACVVKDFFGDGDARPYKEAPKFTCTKSDPLAKRSKVTEQRHVWTFDLTSFAASWIEQGSFVTAVMLMPAKPKEPGLQDKNWRVVLAGPEAKKGVVTTLVYEPPKLSSLGAPPPPPAVTPSADPGTASFGTGQSPFAGGGTTGGFSTSPGTTGAGTDPVAGAAAAATPANEPVDVGEQSRPVAAEEPPPVESLPGYVWLALLAGLAGVSLVRSIVFEPPAGIRPDGVLAQIRRINAERRGAAIDVGTGGEAAALAPLLEKLRSVGHKGRHLAGKLRFGNKR